MKKKNCAFLLSFLLLFSSLNPVMVNAEVSSDVSASDETEVFMEEMETDETIDTWEDEILTEDPVDEEIGDVIIDSIEMETSTPVIAVQTGELNDDQVPTEVSWTELQDQNIKYRYIDTTLYIELIDSSKQQIPTDYSGTTSGPWAIEDNETKAKNVSKIVINDGISAIGNQWFYSLSGNVFQNLTEVVLASSVKTIGEDAFSGDKKLSSINLGKIDSIGDRAFQNNALSQIDLSETKTVGQTAFRGCKIETLSLPKATSIGANAFADCSALKYVSFGKVDITIGKGAFSNQLSAVCYAGSKNKWQEIVANDRFGLKRISLNIVHCQGEDVAETKEPTCIETGVESKICAICNGAYSVEVAALGHDYATEFTTDVQPTCTKAGSESNHCTRCDAADPDSAREIPALGHEWEKKVDQEPTCTEAGSESNHCTRCDAADPDSVKEIPALGHDYKSEVTTQPTCVKDGVRTHTCSRCKNTKTEAIPATGVHQWSNWKTTADATVFAAEQQERTCTTCGKTETQAVGSKLSAVATVNVSSVTLKEKQNTSFVKVTGLAKGDSVKTWKSTNTKVFTVTGKADGTCKLIGVKKGSAKLEITMASGLKKTVTVKVQTKTVTTSKISGLSKKMTVQKGAKATLKPDITPATSQQKVTYSSSNKKVATVSSKGVITAKKAGTAKITVKSGSKKVTVTVTIPKTKTTAITVGEKVSVKKGKTYSLKAKVVPSNSDEKIAYSTSNKKIATVSKSGKIRGVKKGTATITIKSGKVTKKVKVTVK